MPDFLKKAAKRTEAVCDGDEAPLAALFCRPRSGDTTKRLGAPGGAISKVGKLADGRDESASVFAQNSVLVLTDQRLLVFGHGTYTGRVKDLIGEVDLTDIASMDLEAPPVGESGASSLKITFTDGEQLELTPGSRRRRFIEAFESLGQPA